MPPLLRAESLFHGHDLRGVSLAIEPRRLTLLSGAPASGPASLLRILGLLERPDSGELWFASQPLGPLDDAARIDLRNHAFGFLFSEPFLLDSFTAAENVAMPLFKISGLDIEQARDRTAQVLDFTGLALDADLHVTELSILDRHKLALARALAIAPRLLIAQDPGLHLSPSDFRLFAALLRSALDLLPVSVIATSSTPDALAPDREICIGQGVIVSDSNPVPTVEAPAHE